MIKERLCLTVFEYIPVSIQDACFRVFEQFQFKAYQCSHGYSGEYAPAFSYKLHPCSAIQIDVTMK